MADETPDPPPWTKPLPVTFVSIAPGVLDKRITIYHADAASDPPNHPRVVISGTYADGTSFSFDRKFSELSLSDEQNAMIAGALDAACAQVIALEGFLPAAQGG